MFILRRGTGWFGMFPLRSCMRWRIEGDLASVFGCVRILCWPCFSPLLCPCSSFLFSQYRLPTLRSSCYFYAIPGRTLASLTPPARVLLYHLSHLPVYNILTNWVFSSSPLFRIHLRIHVRTPILSLAPIILTFRPSTIIKLLFRFVEAETVASSSDDIVSVSLWWWL